MKPAFDAKRGLPRARSGSGALAALIGVALATGCAGNQRFSHVPAATAVPPVTVSLEASEVRATGSTDAEQLKDIVAHAIEDSVAHQGGESRPGRFLAMVQASHSAAPQGAWCFLFVFATFCSWSNYVATVDLTLDAVDGRYKGNGRSTHLAPHENNEDDQLLVWSATVHDAVQDAMAHMQRVSTHAEAAP